MESYLPVIWAAIIGCAVAMYVILDGFDLGIGILFPFAESEHERDQMMNSVAPFWDGNETWLVLGGAGLMVAFPLAYSIILPAFYLPVIIMLLALVFRGVAFEFRWLGVSSKPHWTFAFAAGSTLAAFCQGVILGGLIEGVKVQNGAFAGGAFDWATPFAVVCGLGLVAGYALLGATWLIMKTEGKIAERARPTAKALLVVVLAFMAIVSLWTPLAFDRIAARWFSLPNILFLWWIPAATALVAFVAWRAIESGREALSFLATIALFLLGYLGLLISNFPYIVPPSLTRRPRRPQPMSSC
jgi:cytochrome d ubiquinol oxidase subunit II